MDQYDEMFAVNTTNSTSLLTPSYPTNSTRQGRFLEPEIMLFNVLHLFALLIGGPTNIINCLVFYRQGLKDRMNLCLFSLSFADILYILGLNILNLFSLGNDINESMFEESYKKVKTVFTGAIYGFRMVSNCYRTIIASERCLCVLFPLHVTTLIRTSAMCGILLLMFIIIQTLYTVPIVLKYQVIAVWDEKQHKVCWKTVPSDIYVNNTFFYDVVLQIICLCVLPVATFLIISLATCVTMVRLRMASKWRAKTGCQGNASHLAHRGLTKMLVIVSGVYIITTCPDVTVSIIRFVETEISQTGSGFDIFQKTYMAANVFSCVNPATSFLVYYNRSSRYRQVLSKIYRRLKSCGSFQINCRFCFKKNVFN